MKLKTGSTFVGQSKTDEQYTEKLKKETLEKCNELSNLYFKVFGKLDRIIEGRKAIKDEVAQLKTLEQGNELVLLNYLEHLILDNHNYELIVPYYSISNDINNPIPSGISVHEHHHFGVLGEVNDILS